MAAKEERFVLFVFSYMNISGTVMSEIVLIAMIFCFLYIICNFVIFSVVNSNMASKMAVKIEKPIYRWYFAVFFLKHHHVFAISRFRCLDLPFCTFVQWKPRHTFEPQHEISNNLTFWHVQTRTSLCSLLLSLETSKGVQSVA